MNYLQRFSLFITFTALFILAGSASVAAEDLIHVVGKGDTVYSISRFYSVSAEALMKENNLSDPSKIQAGARLKIPVDNTQTPSAPVAVTRPEAPLSTANYRVVRGDTLYSIARKNNITLAYLLEINKFSNNHVIKVGDTVKVPAKNTAGSQTQTATQTTASTGTVAPLASGVYALRWPVAPKEISYMTGQMGVVVEGDKNESVKSITQGKVISAGPWRKFGRVVIVESSGGYFYMYGGCETLSVSIGDKVMPGTEVGKLGVNAVSEKPQLFFMVFKNDTPIDPVKAPRAAGTRNS